jgi:hypothetical protein
VPVRNLRSPEKVVVEVAFSKTTGHILLRVESSGVEQLWADDIQELIIDLGREQVLVFRPGQPPSRRDRE